MEPTLDKNQILCFCDVMDNLGNVELLKAVPESRIADMKADKTLKRTIIEYSTSKLVLIDQILYLTHESKEIYYRVAKHTILDFLLKGGPVFRREYRSQLGDIHTDKIKLLEEIKLKSPLLVGHLKEARFEGIYMNIVEVASKALMCFDGELQISYKTRMDLILLNYIGDFKQELKLTEVILTKFPKSSPCWHYRKVIFRICWGSRISRLKEAIKETETIEKKEIDQLRFAFDEQLDFTIKLLRLKTTGHRLFDFLYFSLQLMIDGIQDLINSKEESENELSTELEVLLIESTLKYYDRLKLLCLEFYFENSVFDFMSKLLLTLWRLKIDKFLGDENFYESFMEDHILWTKQAVENAKMKENVAQEMGENKWRSLAMIDYSKLESVHSHLDTIQCWGRYILYMNIN